MDLLASLRRFSLKHDLLPRGKIVVVGVSGGADSLSLLHALRMLAPEFDLRLHVAHLDHQLRGVEAKADADFVRDVAQQWDLPYTIGSRDVHGFSRHYKLSLEETGRQVRYSFLLEVALAQHSETIAVAHNADDQAETVLMHFLRGSGLSGLRGMLPKMLISDLRLPSEPLATGHPQSKIHLIRPLLDMPRSAIDEYCAQHDLYPRVDATNADTTYFRNRLRHELLPFLETYNPQIRSILRRTADVIAADHMVLETHINFAWDMTVLDEEPAALTFSLPLWREQPIGTQRALLRRAIQQLRPPLRDIDFAHIDNALEILRRAVTGDRITLPQNLQIEISYDMLIIAPRDDLTPPDWPQLPAGSAPLAVAAPPTAGVPGITLLPDSAWVLEAAFATDTSDLPGGLSALIDADVLHGPLALRPRQTTDRFHPQGMPDSVRLKDWMINAKIPRALRDGLPLLLCGEHIVWVPGFRVGQPFLVTAATRRMIKFAFKKG
jgi:tRNA(Ile)-lysidine synthase